MDNARGHVALLALAAILAAALAGCGEPAARPADGDTPGPADGAALAPDCDQMPRPPQAMPAPDGSREPYQAAVDAIRAALNYAAEHRDDFGSVWMEGTQTGPVGVAGFAHNVERHRNALRERLGPDAPLEVRQVPNGYGDMEAVVRALSAEGGGDPSGAVAMLDEELNRAIVYVPSLDDATRRDLTARFGAGLICLAERPSPGRQPMQRPTSS